MNKYFEYIKYDLLLHSQGKLFGNDAPKLPQPNMLMIDRIITIKKYGGYYNKGYITAELDINSNMWFFNCHFLGDPIMPGCLILEAMWQLIGFYLSWLGIKGKGRSVGVDKVKFFRSILPSSKKIYYIIHLRRIVKRKFIFGLADGIIICKKNLICRANNLKVCIV
ncbi:MAG: bifunctional 3-hydroxydecanoyl-ACP dehydratase/trans-2-decenoyl-ACP isomerase [Enterobacterales bacterium]